MNRKLSDVREKQEGEADSVIKCWNDILFLQIQQRPLPAIYTEAEKLVQHYVASADATDVGRLRTRVEVGERSAAASLAVDPDDLARQRVHAALAGALAGLVYPIGRSPRDLNRMAF